MTMLSGCNSNNNKVEVRGLLLGKAPSSQEVVDKFNDFLTMFPTKDLTCLYDKDGTSTIDLDYDDLGTWVISSYLHTSDGRALGIVLGFNRNTKEAKGNLIIFNLRHEVQQDDKYPIYYDKDGIHLVDENVEPTIKEELANFNMMFSFISLSREYLDSLEAESFFYNPEVPLYGATYKLTPDDKNIQQIRQLYPNLPIEENNITLDFEGHGTPWEINSDATLRIYLDSSPHDNYFTCSLDFNRSDKFNKNVLGR